MTKLQCWCFGFTTLLLLVTLAGYASVYALEVSPLRAATAQFNDDISSSSSNKLPDGSNMSGLKGKLIFAHVLYRHGDRTPIEPYPTDPWNNPQFWPTGWGQLTNLGKNQHLELGQWLRRRYDGLLSRTYSKDEIYVRSTDVDRTLMSALANLAGMYPPVSKDVWNKNIDWQPIPVHTIPESMDSVLGAKKPCAAYDYARSALLDSPEFQQLNDRYAYLYNYLSKYSGRVIESLDDLQRINNTFFIESLYNKTLPEWTKHIYPSADMTHIAALAFSVNTYTRQLARLKTGPLIKEIFERFSDKIANHLTPDRSVWIYSAHDTTVANVLNTLNLLSLHSPPYAACVLLELRMDDQMNPFVSIFYKNTTAEPLPMHIPGCGTACPLNKMYALYKDILPENWEKECKLSTLIMTYEEANVGAAMGLLLAIIFFLMLISLLINFLYRRHSYRNYFTYSQVA